MANNRAALFSEEFLEGFLHEIAAISQKPTEDVAVFLLSFHAGLRVQEIAGLEWRRHILDVTDKFRSAKMETVSPSGRTVVTEVPYIQITSDIGKHSNERSVEMHIELEPVLADLLGQNGSAGFVIPGRYHVADDVPKDVLLKKRSDALRKRIKRMYEKVLGDRAEGHSSHFGRRNFITNHMRKAPRYGMTLFDVQAMAGHKNSETTKRYVAPSPGRARALRGIE